MLGKVCQSCSFCSGDNSGAHLYPTRTNTLWVGSSAPEALRRILCQYLIIAVCCTEMIHHNFTQQRLKPLDVCSEQRKCVCQVMLRIKHCSLDFRARVCEAVPSAVRILSENILVHSWHHSLTMVLMGSHLVRPAWRLESVCSLSGPPSGLVSISEITDCVLSPCDRRHN